MLDVGFESLRTLRERFFRKAKQYTPPVNRLRYLTVPSLSIPRYDKPDHHCTRSASLRR